MLAQAAFHTYDDDAKFDEAQDTKFRPPDTKFRPPDDLVSLEDEFTLANRRILVRVYMTRSGDPKWSAGPNQTFIVAVRGSALPANWLVNFDAAQVTTDILLADPRKGATVHRGWMEAACEIARALQERVPSLLHGARSVFFVGHSLGGAVALLLATIWANDSDGTRRSVDAYAVTFAAPKPGNVAFAKHCRDLLGKRVVSYICGLDAVPNLPPQPLGYEHAVTPIVLDADLGYKYLGSTWPLIRKAADYLEAMTSASPIRSASELLSRLSRDGLHAHSVDHYWFLLYKFDWRKGCEIHDEVTSAVEALIFLAELAQVYYSLSDAARNALWHGMLFGSVQGGRAIGIGTQAGHAVNLAAASAEASSDASSGVAPVAVGASRLALIGRVAGGLGVATGALQLGLALHELYRGNPTAENCDALISRLQQIKAVYDAEETCKAQATVVRSINCCIAKTEELKSSIQLHHALTHTSHGTAGGVSIASGVCMLAAPSTLGVTAIVGMALAGGAAVTASAATVADSVRSYKFRSDVIGITDELIAAQTEYASSTGRLTDGLMGTPGRFAFEGTGWCQIVMTVRYNSFSGDECAIDSCDACDSWYEGEVRVEPGATNIRVAFSVRGGRDVYQVNRGVEGMPWVYDEAGSCAQEVFHFFEGDGVKHRFKIGGTSLHAYVYEDGVF